MTDFQELYRRWTDEFWLRFTDFTGWDPSPDQQFIILISAVGFLFATLLAIYVWKIMRSSKRATSRDRTVANYQQLRRIQSADDR